MMCLFRVDDDSAGEGGDCSGNAGGSWKLIERFSTSVADLLSLRTRPVQLGKFSVSVRGSEDPVVIVSVISRVKKIF